MTPAILAAPRAIRRPCASLTKIRSSPISALNAPVAFARAISASASELLPEPDGPRIKTPLSPWITAVAWRLALPAKAAHTHAENAGSSTTKRAPAPCRATSSESSRSCDPTANASQFGRPVAGPNATAVSFNDLARNRQSQARILAEPLAWDDPYRIARKCARAHAAGFQVRHRRR